MTFRRVRSRWLVLPLLVVFIIPQGLLAQQDEVTRVVAPTSAYQATPVPATSAKAPAKPASTTPSASDASLDSLTGPIALYPDALVAQILEASKDFAAVQKFGGWLKANGALKGTALQDAAQKAGFAAPYVALAPFPQVIQMMVEKPDWTRQLGAAFTSDPAAVYQSVQRLRAAAMALGNLKTTPQQEVVTETAASGQTIILVQPANPQVVYVPVYNTQVVYVQSAPPPSSSANVAAAAMIGFTAGIIIGASSNHYYYGPYAWRGGAAHYAYERREDYVDHRQDLYEDRADNRQDAYENRAGNVQQNQSQRQSAAQANQSQRQTTAQTNQGQRQSTAQANQTTRSSAASASTARAGGASSYQSGNAAKAQSARGSASRSSSRSGGGSRRK